ncbi:PD40 domain-containing protein [Ohtaekwangia koreensis]|uniref:WD40-like Beta Propeller Repeat n=1 Tax=Ohtaekwangia koreensis TaxID=688867 RepID=A0A1T5M2Q2_9BACT|nr:PD40 domain-containing protein [Ohtaekwangia koreensis]SKC82510.1 WD40-like Beta Propeller Repeat [Ohtaekwangia koreensis]
MVKYFFFFATILSSIAGTAQNVEFGEARKLSSSINTEAEELMPLLSSDGYTLYFARSLSPLNTGGQYAGTDVWMSRYDVTSKDWGKADNNRSGVNTGMTDIVIGTSAKGDILYLLRTAPTRKTKGIYTCRKISDSWGDPELIPIEGFDSQQFLGVFVSPDLEVIFISMMGEDSEGEEDLYVSVKNPSGGWSKPKNLGPTINTSGFEIAPYLSQDKKRLYFSSSGHGGAGDADIFYSERLYDSWEAWSVPKNMEKLNTKNFDAYFSVYGDSVAFFASNRAGGSSEIYTAKTVKPAVEIKTDSREYLTDAQVEAQAGKVVTVYKFAPSSSSLSEKQMQQLMKLSTAFAPSSTIKIHLVAHKPAESASLDVYQKRLFTILNQLKRGGITGSRITFGVELKNATSISDEEQVDILFYK